MTAAERVASEVQLRAEFRDAIQSLSNARRADAWAILNALIALAREDV